MIDLPFVSIIMPVRNEADFISRSLTSILNQDYPRELMEVFVLDGMSIDNTRKIVVALKEKYKCLKLIDNPQKVVPPALNMALDYARGEVIIWVSGHSEVAPDFIKQGIRALAEHPEAWSVGGPITHEGSSVIGRGTALALSKKIVIGNALHRIPSFEGYAEGAPLPFIRRWVFDKIGRFDESLVRNADDEFYLRIRLAGGKIFLSRSIKYKYFVRDKINQLFRQYFQYGFWRILAVRKHRFIASFRHTIPPIFFISIIIMFFAGAFFKNSIVAFFLPFLYLLLLLILCLENLPKAGLRVGICMPLVIITMHTGYAFGFICGIWASFFQPNLFSRSNKMAKISR